MTYEIKPNSGSAFINDRKRPGMKDADYAGKVKIEDQIYYVNIWRNTTKSGAEYFGLKFNAYRGRPEGEGSEPVKKASPPPSGSSPAVDPEFDDDIPF